MNLGMDSTGLVFTSNFPYPNLECTVKFICLDDNSISTEIIAVSYDPYNTWP